MSGGAAGVTIGISGTAVVCCVHDREKRLVTTEGHLAEIGKTIGRVFDPVQDKVWLCACCDNLFVDPSDEPRFCFACMARPTHPLGGPLPNPNERPI